MRFITYEKNSTEAVGVRVGAELIELCIAAPELPRTLLGLIQAGVLEAAGKVALTAGVGARRPVEGIKYLPLIPRPPKFFGFGINYGSHVGERPKTPGFFISVPTRFVGHNEAMVVPAISKTLDYEVELALVIKKGGKNIPASEALDYIAGYTIFNDGSVRGHGAGNTLSIMKNGDKTGPLGPELVTPDELPGGCDGLRIITRRNGNVVQDDTTANMFWKVPEIIAMTSSYMSLEAGDVITTGTCGGTVVEFAVKQGRSFDDETLPWLQPGEVIECEIEGIGVLKNHVIGEAKR